MTNQQWAMMQAGVARILSTAKLGRNRLLIIYRPWTNRRKTWSIVCRGVKHHNDKWEIIMAGPVDKSTGRLDTPFKGVEGYRY